MNDCSVLFTFTNETEHLCVCQPPTLFGVRVRSHTPPKGGGA